MKKRFSEYVKYDYKNNEEWFNPQVEWDTPLFIDSMLMKKTDIPEFQGSYQKIVDFFANCIVKLETGISDKEKREMLHFDEVKEANLGYSYDSNGGNGLTGKTAMNVLDNLKHFIDEDLFRVEDFATISLFDGRVSADRMSDMVLNITKNDFVKYSCRIAQENSFPIKKFNLKREFNFNTMKWVYEETNIPYIVDEDGKEIPVLLVPRKFLNNNLFWNSDDFIGWLYVNEKDFLKSILDYNLKKDLKANNKKILKEIISTGRSDILKRYSNVAVDLVPYDLELDKKSLNNTYEKAQLFYSEIRPNLIKIKYEPSKMPVIDIVELLVEDLKTNIIDQKGYTVIMPTKNRFIAETKISKFVQLLFQNRIKDAGFNIDISPETNSGHGPVDFKFSRGDDKVLLENKVGTNPKLLTCIDEGKQLHTYLKQEQCRDAYLLVFTCNSNQNNKVKELMNIAEKYRPIYNIIVEEIDCTWKDSASHR